ncbi:MAG: T9SS type A sorting domain-containing protein [Bacteroidetes bacterium]|nr:T9SS type A sorting domain-containing protein [Bacteroidota bacterium]
MPKSQPLFLAILACLCWFNPAFGQYFDFTSYTGNVKKNTFPKSAFGDESATIRHMHFDNGDTLWAGTYKSGLIKWWKGPSNLATYWWIMDQTPGKEIYHVLRLNQKWVFYTDFNSFTNEYTGLYQLKSRTVMKEPKLTKIAFVGDSTAPLLPRVHSLAAVGDTTLLMATDSGLYLFDGKSKWRRRNKGNVKNITEWKIDHVTATSTGGIYLGSQTNVYRLLGSNWERLDLSKEPFNLKKFNIKKMLTGYMDTIWVVTNLGVVKIHNDTSFFVPNHWFKPTLNEIKDIAFDKDGNPWIAFEFNGGIVFQDMDEGKKVWRRVNSTNSPLPDEVAALACDARGHMWVGTDNNGMFEYLSYTPGNVAEPLLLQSFEVYPNPAPGEVSIGNPSDKLAHIAVYDVSGNLVVELDVKGRETQTLRLTPGLYLLKGQANGAIWASKIAIY